MHDQDHDRVFKPGEVAAMFRVDPKTVTRWAQAGLLPSIVTPGGHRRYRQADLLPLLEPIKPVTRQFNHTEE